MGWGFVCLGFFACLFAFSNIYIFFNYRHM